MSFAKQRRPSVTRLTATLAVVTLLLSAPGAAMASNPTTAAPTDTSTTTGTPRAVTRPPVAEPETSRRVVTRPTTAQDAAAVAAPKAAQAAAAAVTASTSLTYTSEAGDWVGQGQSETFTAPTDTVSISGTENHLSVNVSNATSSSWWPTATAGAANEVYGSFTVNQIGFDASGAVNLADVSFLQRCESEAAPAFRGTIHLNQLPLSYRQVSDAGDYIGGGVTKTYLNSTSIVTVQGTASSISLNVSGLRDWWYGSISAPTGSNFVVGKTYQTARFSDDTHAGLDIFGDGRGCNSSTGTVAIKKLQLSASGAITNLSAVFEQHCEGGTPALNGTIRYFA